MRKEVVAILVADLHFSHVPPVARSAENWYGVMARYCRQLSELTLEYRCPLVCAGDVFDKWNQPPELINFVSNHMPQMFAVPGQHDMPYHNYDQMHKSAYQTLVDMEQIIPIELIPRKVNGLVLHGYYYNQEIKPIEVQNRKGYLHVLVAHRYVWYRKHKFRGAPKKYNIGKLRELHGYDAAVFGDNHKGFLTNVGDTNVLNCGTFMRRTVDEIDYRPRVGLLYGDGRIKEHYLDCSEDVLTHNTRLAEAFDSEVMDMTSLINSLNKLQGASTRFRSALIQVVESNSAMTSEVKEHILDIIQDIQ